MVALAIETLAAELRLIATPLAEVTLTSLIVTLPTAAKRSGRNESVNTRSINRWCHLSNGRS